MRGSSNINGINHLLLRAVKADGQEKKTSLKETKSKPEATPCQGVKLPKITSACRTYDGKTRKNVYKALVRAFLKDYRQNKTHYQEGLRSTFADCDESILAALEHKLERCDSEEKKRARSRLKKDYKNVVDTLGENKHYLYILVEVLSKLLDPSNPANKSLQGNNSDVYHTTFQELHQYATRRLRWLSDSNGHQEYGRDCGSQQLPG